jgi:hypothetical protein
LTEKEANGFPVLRKRILISNFTGKGRYHGRMVGRIGRVNAFGLRPGAFPAVQLSPQLARSLPVICFTGENEKGIGCPGNDLPDRTA